MKTNKLLVFVIAFAIVMSFAVIPVNAAPVNLAGEITGITDNVVSHTATVKASDDATAPKWVLSNATATYSDGVVSVHRTSSNSQYGLLLANAPLQSGKKYYIEGLFRADKKPASTTQIRFYVSNSAGSTNKASVNGISASGESGSITNYVYPTDTTSWVKSSGYFTVGTNESGTTELGLNLGIKVGSVGNSMDYDYSVKDIKLYEVKTFTGVAEANGATGAVFTFANDVKTADTSNFAVTSTDANAATPNVSLVTEGDTCTVSLSGYSWDTTYTITASGVKDMFNQTLSAPVSVNVTTPKKPANIAGKITGITDNVVAHTAVVKASAEAAAPNWGVTTGATATYQDGVISITQRTADASSGLYLSNLGVESGKTYYISGQFKCDQAPTSGSFYARFYMGNIDKTNNKAVIPTGITGQTETDSITKSVNIVNNTGWQTVDGIFTVGADDGTKELGLYLGIKVGQNTNASSFLYSVKDIVVYELTTLDINSNYKAKVIKGDNDTVTLYITGPDSVVYLAAASYEGKALKDVKLAQRNITSVVRTISVKAGDNYKIMIWDSQMNPLCEAFFASDI